VSVLDGEERGVLCLLWLTIDICVYMCVYVYIKIQIDEHNK